MSHLIIILRAQYRLRKYYQLLVNSFVDIFLSYMYFMMFQKTYEEKYNAQVRKLHVLVL